MNTKLQRLTKAVKYTTMGDIWREIDEGAHPEADKRSIVDAFLSRLRCTEKAVKDAHGQNWFPAFWQR